VHTCRSACALPLIGVGGIASGWDALEFLLAGATAIQVGSAAFREPLLARRVRGELATLLAERDLPRGEASKTTTLD
jgi:dihydroorotate dehydrogenase (NAD+) catalytic subunit